MKTLHSTALIALLTATIGLSAAAPAFAQGPMDGPVQIHRHHAGPGPMHGGPGFGPRGFGGGFFGFGAGAEAVEVALVRLSHRVDLTAEQQPLFDAFREAALAAATELEATVEGLKPANNDEDLDIAGRFSDRLAIERARLEAMEAVEPSLTAFFDSLTDEQLDTLKPRREGRPHFRLFGPGKTNAEEAPEPTTEG
ncbi:Spy/CpxP family protein refolding chaperone [Devosia albogilva]|uniref:Spy/CpxP family protein refolding chaperone n=1 Tax=Devosia albogilva TaxID=429726 RepID=A0ABW5QGB3_9HYPH